LLSVSDSFYTAIVSADDGGRPTAKQPRKICQRFSVDCQQDARLKIADDIGVAETQNA
jgi:hypothetical protein